MNLYRQGYGASILSGALLLILIAGACGRSAGEDAEAGGNAGGPSAAGTTSIGGSGHAGFPSGAAGFQTGRTGQPYPCELPQQAGDCDAVVVRYYNDPNGLCRPFSYSGCGGNDNNFETLAACQAACGPLGADHCTLPTDCTISCCTACESRPEDLQLSDLISYNAGNELGVYDGCSPSSCECDELTPEQRVAHFFVPTCVKRQCAVADIRLDDVTACETADDCTLRLGTACCEGCGDDDSVVNRLVAVRSGGSFEDFVCGEGERVCDDCAAQYPPGTRADCVEGRCAVAY